MLSISIHTAYVSACGKGLALGKHADPGGRCRAPELRGHSPQGRISSAPPPQLPGASRAPGMSAVTVRTGDSVPSPAASRVSRSLLTKLLLILSIVLVTAIETITVISP